MANNIAFSKRKKVINVKEMTPKEIFEFKDKCLRTRNRINDLTGELNNLSMKVNVVMFGLSLFELADLLLPFDQVPNEAILPLLGLNGTIIGANVVLALITNVISELKQKKNDKLLDEAYEEIDKIHEENEADKKAINELNRLYRGIQVSVKKYAKNHPDEESKNITEYVNELISSGVSPEILSLPLVKDLLKGICTRLYFSTDEIRPDGTFDFSIYNRDVTYLNFYYTDPSRPYYAPVSYKIRYIYDDNNEKHLVVNCDNLIIYPDNEGKLLKIEKSVNLNGKKILYSYDANGDFHKEIVDPIRTDVIPEEDQIEKTR